MQDEYFIERLKAHMLLVEEMLGSPVLLGRIREAGRMIASCMRGGGRLLLCGNGGSAADCQHIAAEFTGRFLRKRGGLSAESLTTNTSSLTAIANDFGFNEVFRRQVEAQGRKGDLLFGLSTSGNSANVVLAMERAREMGLSTIGLCGGAAGAEIEKVSDCLIAVPSSGTPRIQEAHILIGHLLCGYVEDELAGQLPDQDSLSTDRAGN